MPFKVKIAKIIETYNTVLNVVDNQARNSEDRAYGGVIRSVKGKLQEYITEELIKIAWIESGGEINRLLIDSRKHRIKINNDYIEKITDTEIKEHILANINNYYYGISVDKQVYVDMEFVLGIECKAYTENAMIKRILVDFTFLKSMFPDINCYLFQLESQLGGDFSFLDIKTFGSKSTHTIMSYFEDIELNIVTLLKGERKVKKPIHKFFKPLPEATLIKAVELLKMDLIKYV